MNWNNLRTFYYVTKAKSISKASEQLNTSVSAISRQILNLENRLNIPLFQRHTNGVSLTEHGAILFKKVENIVSTIEEYQLQLRSENNNDIGSIKLISNFGLVNTWLTSIIPDFMKAHPKINLSIIGDNREITIPSSVADVALAPLMPNKVHVIQKFLMSWNRKLYASPKYIEKFGLPKKTDDLNNHRLIGFGTPSIYLFENINWHLYVDCPSDFIRQPYCSVNSVKGLFDLACADIGIVSFSEESLLLRDSNLIQVLPDIKGPKIDIYFICPKQLKGMKCVHTLEKFLFSIVAKNHKKAMRRN